MSWPSQIIACRTLCTCHEFDKYIFFFIWAVCNQHSVPFAVMYCCYIQPILTGNGIQLVLSCLLWFLCHFFWLITIIYMSNWYNSSKRVWRYSSHHYLALLHWAKSMMATGSRDCLVILYCSSNLKAFEIEAFAIQKKWISLMCIFPNWCKWYGIKIWFLMAACRLAFAARCFTVPPIPSLGLYLRGAIKKCHFAS